MNTPTPMTDAEHAQFPMGGFTLDFARRLERELTAMSEQRDEWKAKYIQQNKDLGCEQMDPDGTIWDYASKVQTDLSSMTEQRDRLAEALKEIYNVSAFDYDSMPEIARRKYREVVSEMADAALQSLNQPEP